MPNEPVGKDDFNRYVDRHDRAHGEMDARIARDMVPLSLYMADQRANERRFTELERDISERATQVEVTNQGNRLTAVEARPGNVRNYLIALAGLALTLLGIVVSAYFSSKGGT